MGHGFSKMLQMVNMDLLKSVEMVKDTLSDGEQSKDDISHQNTQEPNINNNDHIGNNINKKMLPKILFTSKENNNWNNQNEDDLDSPKRMKGPKM